VGSPLAKENILEKCIIFSYDPVFNANAAAGHGGIINRQKYIRKHE
jgi:hypothetical protein